MNRPIPEAALKKHIAILGMNGSGKTSVAKSQIIEPALEAGERVCNIDPTGVGWGLRLSATGKSKGYSIYIVGGSHADFPLFRRDGKAWGEIVGTSSDSFVFDTSQMTVSDRSLWFTDFAETILRLNKGPLKLVIDEAHLFAPQGGAKGGGATPDMLHATNNLLALGRSRGLRITMISQRPAKLHKDSLTQAHTLIAMSLMAPHDRAAVSEWIADQADAAQGKEIVASLPSLEPGEGWIWAPREKVLQRVRFSRPKTFDSSSAPDDGDGEGPSLPPINPDAIKAKLETVAKETVANDPKALRAELARLKADMAKAVAAQVVPVDPKTLQAEYERGLAEGLEDGFASGFNAAQNDACKAIMALPGRALDAPARPAAKIMPAPRPKPAPPPRANGHAPASGISRPQQRILDALAWLEMVGLHSADKVRVAMLADQSSKSSGFRANLSTLSGRDLIAYVGDGDIALTEEGRAAANQPDRPPTSEELQAAIRDKISGPQWRMLEALIPAYPESLPKEELAVQSDQSPLSSGFRANLSTLSGFGFIKYQRDGSIAAEPILFVG